MSVPENARTKSKLEVNVKAHDLCCYTLQITANKKIFTENYQASKGNCFKCIQRMDAYYKSLWGE